MPGSIIPPEQSAPLVGGVLRQTKNRLTRVLMMAAVCVLLAGTAVFLLGFVVADHYIDGGVPNGARAGLMALYVVAVAIGVIALIVLPAVRRISDVYTARLLERTHPTFRNSLVNAIQLTNHEKLPGSVRSALLARAAVDAAHADVRRAVALDRLRQAGIALGAAALIFLGYAIIAPKPVLPSVLRAFGASRPAPTRTTILDIEPADGASVIIGRPVTFTARLAGRMPAEAHVHFSPDCGATTLNGQRLSLAPAGPADASGRARIWQGTKAGQDMQQTVFWRLTAGDTSSAWRRLAIRPLPDVTDLRVTCVYPAYTGLRSKGHSAGESADIDAVIGTQVTVEATTNVPVRDPVVAVAAGTGDGDETRLPMQHVDLDASRISGQFTVLQDGQYYLRFFDRDGEPNQDPIRHTIRARPDKPPLVTLVSPRGDVVLEADEPLSLYGRVEDDFGVSRLTIEYRRGSQLASISLPMPADRPTTQPTSGPVRDLMSIGTTVPLARFGALPGDTIEWRLAAWDNHVDLQGRLAPQKGVGPLRRIVVRTPEAIARAEPPQQGQPPALTTRPADTRGPDTRPAVRDAQSQPSKSKDKAGATTRPADTRLAALDRKSQAPNPDNNANTATRPADARPSDSRPAAPDREAQASGPKENAPRTTRPADTAGAPPPANGASTQPNRDLDSQAIAQAGAPEAQALEQFIREHQPELAKLREHLAKQDDPSSEAKRDSSDSGKPQGNTPDKASSGEPSGPSSDSPSSNGKNAAKADAAQGASGQTAQSSAKTDAAQQTGQSTAVSGSGSEGKTKQDTPQTDQAAGAGQGNGKSTQTAAKTGDGVSAEPGKGQTNANADPPKDQTGQPQASPVTNDAKQKSEAQASGESQRQGKGNSDKTETAVSVQQPGKTGGDRKPEASVSQSGEPIRTAQTPSTENPKPEMANNSGEAGRAAQQDKAGDRKADAEQRKQAEDKQQTQQQAPKPRADQASEPVEKQTAPSEAMSDTTDPNPRECQGPVKGPGKTPGDGDGSGQGKDSAQAGPEAQATGVNEAQSGTKDQRQGQGGSKDQGQGKSEDQASAKPEVETKTGDKGQGQGQGNEPAEGAGERQAKGQGQAKEEGNGQEQGEGKNSVQTKPEPQMTDTDQKQAKARGKEPADAKSESESQSGDENAGQGEGKGKEQGQGEGQGKGEGQGQGQGEGKGQGQGQGEGEGQGEGQGKGEGQGQGQGEGQGKGKGQGEGKGEGQGEGQGKGEGQGEGKGQGQGKGEGRGEGQGEGQGNGRSQGQGSGNQPGYGPGGGSTQSNGLDNSVAPRNLQLPASPEGSARLDTLGDVLPVIDALEQRLRKKDVDPKLLDDLGWDETRANDFVRDFRRAERQVKEQTDPAAPPPERFETTTRPSVAVERSNGANIDVAPLTARNVREADKKNQLYEVGRQKISDEYRDYLKAYYESIARDRSTASQPTK